MKKLIFATILVFLLPVFPAQAVSLEQAARQVQSRHGGRILGAQTRNIRGRQVHVIKMLSTDGKRVKQYQVDAGSGGSGKRR